MFSPWLIGSLLGNKSILKFLSLLGIKQVSIPKLICLVPDNNSYFKFDSVSNLIPPQYRTAYRLEGQEMWLL